MTAFLIFSGYNMRSVFAFIRTLEQHSLPYGIIAATNDDPVRRSVYRDRIVATRSSNALEAGPIRHVLEAAAGKLRADRYLVAPSSEALNRFLLANRPMLQSMQMNVPLADAALYALVSDKSSFVTLCRQSSIPVPAQFPSAGEAPLPFVAKPTAYTGWERGATLKPVLVRTEAERDRFLAEFGSADFFFQEYVQGNSYYLLYYFFRDGRPPLAFSQENLVQQEDGGSILAATSSDLHEYPVCRAFATLFTGIGFRGLVMVELRGNKEAPRMIEANPRFWGPSQLFVDAGVNFFEAMLSDHGFAVEPRRPDSSDPVTRYFWDDGSSFNAGRIDKLLFHNYSPDRLRREYEDWDRHSLFRRPDTRELYREMTASSEPARVVALARLKSLYGQASKHSNYQVIAPLLRPLLAQEDVVTRTRYEQERFEFVRSAVPLRDRRVLDIGGNTGYFTFEALREGASVTYVEGNAAHAEFVAQAADVLGIRDRIEVRNRYYEFSEAAGDRHDVIFLLNVLHHVGDDFGSPELSREQARRSILESLRRLAERAGTVVFQLGFNWKGNVHEPLFEHGTKREMIDFLREGLAGIYSIERIGIAERLEGRVTYRDPDDRNIERRDELGEFLNRPIFVLRSIL